MWDDFMVVGVAACGIQDNLQQPPRGGSSIPGRRGIKKKSESPDVDSYNLLGVAACGIVD